MPRRLDSLEEKIRKCLKEYPETRNDDVTLTLKLIELQLPGHVHVSENGIVWITEQAVRSIREDQVKRIRAFIQNVCHEFLPTVYDVRKKRHISEVTWSKYLGYQLSTCKE